MKKVCFLDVPVANTLLLGYVVVTCADDAIAVHVEVVFSARFFVSHIHDVRMRRIRFNTLIAHISILI